jgi:CheY-like chemotaxis protein
MLHRVLVVDDQRDIREALQVRMLSEGYEVETCERGLDALILALQAIRDDNCFDVFILDCSMPYVDGFTTAQIIRKIESTGVTSCRAWIAAYTATAYGTALEKTNLLEKSGADGYFVKASDETEMILQISHWVELKKNAERAS